ncbi:MAG: hypothetical protein KKC18_09375, partial [Chloroflexi bacterium]|nr:hypothetical protein [Chloroflexota bacterium]
MSKPTTTEIHGDVSGQVGAGERVTQVGDVHSGGRVTIEQIGTQVIQAQPPARPPYQPPPPPAPDAPSPAPGPLPPGSHLPFHPNATFTGRVQPLKTLARALLHDGAASTLVTQAVQGMGGVGKTQLAVEFAHRYGRYFCGVHWLNGALPEGISAQIALCGQAMGLDNWPQEQPEQVALTLREWRRGGARLVILDNLEEVTAAREWLARLGG